MISSAAPLPPNPSPLSDAELLERVAARKVDPFRARRAEAEFYERHARYLYAVLMRRAKGPLALTGAEVEDLVQETFFRAFERAHTFTPGDCVDGDELSRRARGWLGRIAQHLLADWLDGRREIAASPFLETVPGRDEDAPRSSRSPRRELVRAALDELSERERDVLRVSALYHRPGEEHQRLPNAVAAELATRWGTSGENIRAIRSRAMKKLREMLTARAQASAEAEDP
jgi:RNA polymerase sigma factor (sigma-70 family)